MKNVESLFRGREQWLISDDGVDYTVGQWNGWTDIYFVLFYDLWVFMLWV